MDRTEKQMLKNQTKILTYLFYLFFSTFTFTKLRIYSTPVGISELSGLCLLFFLLSTVKQIRISILTWIMSAIAITIFFSTLLNSGITLASLHNILAYIYAAILSWALLETYKLTDFDSLLWSGIKLFSAMMFIMSISFLFIGSGNIDINPFSFFGRFTGLSQNPNQLALVLVTLPWLSLCFDINDSKTVSAFIGISLGLAAGLCRSDALTLCYLLIGAISVGFAFYNNRKKHLFFLVPLLLTFIVTIVTLRETIHFSDADNEATRYLPLATGYGEDKVTVRKDLFIDGLNLISKKPLLGYGATAGILLSDGIKHEAHNLLIDLTLQGGTIALGFFLFLALTVIKRSIHPFIPGVFLASGAFLLFSMFHFTLRSPLLMIIIAASLFMAGRKSHEQVP